MSSPPMILCLPLAAAGRLGGLRQRAGLQVAVEGDRLWLRVDEMSDSLDRQLRAIAFDARYLLLDTAQLVREGDRVPSARLPGVNWVGLRQWLLVELPATLLAARAGARVPITLVRSDSLQEPNLIRTPLVRWSAYAISAPQVRLNQWSFAVSSTGEAVIRGTPIPSLAGTRFVERAGVAIEAGYGCQPPVAPEVLAASLRVSQGEVILAAADGTWQRIAAEAFVRASRSAVRQTRRRLNHA